ncbi:hypothetical protein BGZ96_000763 [Linnemannia gamsii]|uniref:Uncharacterized protein n=1 Tax=Linnemannia gamsii TaxID=64522 RepID=A0ABQ7KAN4_9FUNG|nr:hypothetical protein BGZ96_000763 [Linnemannia gamsii]
MSDISEVIAQVMFKHSNSGAPKPPTQTRQQRQQQQNYPLPTTLCSVSLHDSNKIRVINAPPTLVPLLRQAIIGTWKEPIKQESHHPYSGGGIGTYEFMLGGKPWAPSKSGPLITSTNLVLALKRTMERADWSLVLASNLSRVREENDTFFFEWAAANGPKDGAPWLSSQAQSRALDADQMTLVGEFDHKDKKGHFPGAQEQVQELAEEGSVNLVNIELSGYDTIRVTSGAPVDLLTALRLAFLRHWSQGMEKENDKKQGVHEFLLAGCPFQTWGSETTIEVAMMIIQTLENMRLHGYKLVESTDLDIVGGSKGPQDKKEKKKEKKELLLIDSWVFRRIQQ